MRATDTDPHGGVTGSAPSLVLHRRRLGLDHAHPATLGPAAWSGHPPPAPTGAPRASARRGRRGAGRYRGGVLETVYLVLLVITFGIIGWFGIYAIYKLYSGQR